MSEEKKPKPKRRLFLILLIVGLIVGFNNKDKILKFLGKEPPACACGCEECKDTSCKDCASCADDCVCKACPCGCEDCKDGACEDCKECDNCSCKSE